MTSLLRLVITSSFCLFISLNGYAQTDVKTDAQAQTPQSQALKDDKINLKRVMKKMRFHYSQASKTPSVDEFNQHVAKFSELLDSALNYKFSDERKNTSLEGLQKVAQIIKQLPQAQQDSLFKVQKQWREIDQLRVDYHKKVKPSPWGLLLDYLGLGD